MPDRGEGKELNRNYRDIIGGPGLCAIGGATALYALSSYTLGTVTRMGPGLMPTTLAAMLLVFGATIAIPAVFRKGEPIDLRFRPLIVLSACILSLALMIADFGLVPSVFATTLLGTFAKSKITLVCPLMLSVATSLLTWSIFILGLDLTLLTFGWPF